MTTCIGQHTERVRYLDLEISCSAAQPIIIGILWLLLNLVGASTSMTVVRLYSNLELKIPLCRRHQLC